MEPLLDRCTNLRKNKTQNQKDLDLVDLVDLVKLVSLVGMVGPPIT